MVVNFHWKVLVVFALHSRQKTVLGCSGRDVDDVQVSTQTQILTTMPNSNPINIVTRRPLMDNTLTTFKPTENCPYNEFGCTDGKKCYTQAEKCNGEDDCYDGSDEDHHHCGKLNPKSISNILFISIYCMLKKVTYQILNIS